MAEVRATHTTNSNAPKTANMMDGGVSLSKLAGVQQKAVKRKNLVFSAIS